MVYDLSRFTAAHQRDYEKAFNEIKNGRKMSHWMWYIFPIVRGLGKSEISQFYGICDIGEAKAFLNDPYLGGNLCEISNVLLTLKTNDAREVFGRPDDWKLKASMTLFAYAGLENGVFKNVIDKYFKGKKDCRTMKALGMQGEYNDLSKM